MLWADLLRVIVPGVALGLLLGWVLARRPVHIRRIKPKVWIPKAKSMGRRKWIELIALSLSVALFSLFISIQLGNLLLSSGVEMYSPEEFPFVKMMDYPVLMLLTVNLVPIFEEWIFRGIVIDEVKRLSRSTALALAVSTLSFAAFHLTNPGTYAAYVIPMIPCGVLLGLCYLRVGLGGAILAHSSYNTFLFILQVL
ncbi:MAG: type II CAAX endopeptidase family protein [Candidatus Hadarchaeales archaeon]